MEFSLVSDLYQSFLIAFTDPKKRVFWGYLLAALLLGFVYLKWRCALSSKQALGCILDKRIWWSQSSKADYAIFVINKCSLLLLAPLLVTQLTIATWIFHSLHEWVGERPLFSLFWPEWAVMAVFTFCYFLLDDFSRFFVHKLLHEVPFLWAFHKVHHSARTLTPMTVFRTHPVESLLFSLRSTFVQAITIAVFVFVFGDKADLVTVLGATIFAFMFNVLGSNLRHSHIPLGYFKAIERWFISPAQHQIHHSTNPIHFDKNYGVVLSAWDRMSGTLVLSEKGQQLSFGLQKQEMAREQNLIFLYLKPLQESVQSFLSWVSRVVYLKQKI